MPAEPRITLVTRPGCHLCDDARRVVQLVAADAGVAWRERSLADEPALEGEYSELVPVVLVDGRRIAYWRVDAAQLREALRAGAAGPSWTRRWRRGATRGVESRPDDTGSRR